MTAGEPLSGTENGETGGRLVITLDGQILLDQDRITEVRGESDSDGQISVTATFTPRPRTRSHPGDDGFLRGCILDAGLLKVVDGSAPVNIDLNTTIGRGGGVSSSAEMRDERRRAQREAEAPHSPPEGPRAVIEGFDEFLRGLQLDEAREIVAGLAALQPDRPGYWRRVWSAVRGR